MHRINMYITAVLILILFVYLAFIDTLAKPIFERQATQMYGAEVSIDSLKVSPFVGKITLFQLQVADRSNPLRNLVQADRVLVDIDLMKLAEDVVEVEEMEVDGLVVFAPRQQPARILRPLLPDDSAIATVTLPNFALPDVDQLIDRQRGKLDAEVNALKQSITAKRLYWEEQIDSLPGEEEVAAYKARIRELKQSGGLVGKLASVQEIQAIYAEIDQDITRMRSMRDAFRGDVQAVREEISAASQIPERHVDELIASMGLSSEQIARLGSYLLRGDLQGLTQQVLAPLAYSAAGEISAEDTMPIHIRHAQINGSLLPSAAGFSASGEIRDFTWPLEIAELPAILTLAGTSMDGGSLQIDATVDHRDSPADAVRVKIDKLPLREMHLAGSETLGIVLEQTLANFEGELRVAGENLSGRFDQHLQETLFRTNLREGAGDAARLVAAMLNSSREFNMQVDFSGTLQQPELHLSSDLDSLIENTLRSAVSDRVSSLTEDLQNRLSSEIGPEIQAARGQFAALESLQAALGKDLEQLSKVAK